MSGNNKTFTLSVARVSTPGQVRYMGTQADNLGKNTVVRLLNYVVLLITKILH